MKRLLFVLLSGLNLLVSVPSVFATPYTLVRLNTDPRFPSAAHFINNSGQIVGYIKTGAYVRATLFDPRRGFAPIDLGTLGGPASEALCINDRGQIVGWAQNGAGQERATLFDPTGGGNNIDLGTLGGNGSRANAINENGQIVGEADISSVWSRRATVFDSTGGGNNLDLGTLGGNYSRANTINDQGQIMGNATTPISGVSYATVFDPTGNGNNGSMGPLAVTSINEQGQPVGYSCGATCGAVRYRYTNNSQGGGYWEPVLIHSCGLTEGDTLAYCINNNGLVVGTACLTVAALWDPFASGTFTDLNNLAANRGDWVLCSANAINDRDEIVGVATGGPYLLTPDWDGDGVGDYYDIGSCDLDHDGDVDLADFAEFSGQWQRDNCTQPDFCGGADADHDGGVHLDDLIHFVRFWLFENGE